MINSCARLVGFRTVNLNKMATILELELQKRQIQLKKLEAETELLKLKSARLKELSKPAMVIRPIRKNRDHLMGCIIAVAVSVICWAILIYFI